MLSLNQLYDLVSSTRSSHHLVAEFVWQVVQWPKDSYLYKTVQGNDPVGDLKLGWKTLSSLYKYNNQKTPDPMRTLAWAMRRITGAGWEDVQSWLLTPTPQLRSCMFGNHDGDRICQSGHPISHGTVMVSWYVGSHGVGLFPLYEEGCRTAHLKPPPRTA